MAIQTYKVKLAGQSQLHQPVVKLENIEINLWSIDAGVTWENKGVDINVTGLLEVFMSCKAISGTDWECTITNIGSSAKVFSESGATGDVDVNFSERSASVNP